MKTKKLVTAMLLFGSVMTASAADYYVSPEGAGNKDGSSWENAWGVAELCAKTGDSNKNFATGDNVYFASGKYLPTSIIRFYKGVNLIGSTSSERTIFHGDNNSDGTPNTDDRNRLFYIITNVAANTDVERVNISNIDFECLYMNQDGGSTNAALFIQNCGAKVTISDCNFRDITSTGYGGAAILSQYSTVDVKNCTFTNIKAANRGIAVRLTSNNASKGYTTFENCLFENNEATGAASDPCGVVMMQHGREMTFTNCVFRNNICNGKGGAIWNGSNDNTYPRTLVVENTLFYNNVAAESPSMLTNANNTTTVTNSWMEDDSNVDPRISISGVGYGTYFLSCSYTMPAGVTGKTISAAADGALTYGETYNAGDEVPAGTALLVSGTEGKYEPVLATVETSAPENLLKGSDVAAETVGADKYYKLANDADGLGFYWGANDGAAFTNGAHKAYLALSNIQSAKMNFFSLDGEATGINNVANDVMRHGKYVENGTIVLVRNGIKYNVQGIKL